MNKKKKYGSRLEVWRGSAQLTTGGLGKAQLTKNRNGKIVSKKKSLSMKRSSNLKDYLTVKKRDSRSRGYKTEISGKNVVKGKRRRKKVNYSE